MLKAIVADLSTVDEAHKALYTEKNGKFVLNVEATDGFALEDVAGLRTALQAERAAHAAAKNALKPFEGLDPASVRTAIDRVSQFGDLDPNHVKTTLASFDKLSKIDPEKEAERLAEEKVKNSKAQIESRFNADKVQLETKLNETAAQLARRQAQVEKLLKTNTITSELAKLNPLDEARDVLEIMAANAVKLQDVNGEYIPVVVGDDGQPRTKLASDYSSVPFTVADLMAEMREKRPSLFKADQKIAGLGTVPGQTSGRTPSTPGEMNPWAKGSVNITQQVAITARDPARAARLRSEAGVA